MGKQKSFIIVSLSFIAFILIILLVKVVTSGVIEIQMSFAEDNYTLEIGKQRALAPNIYASGDISDFDFEFLTDDSSVIEVSEGTWSTLGTASVPCWSFTILERNELVFVNSKIPYKSSDIITIEDGFWCVNGVKTKYEANENYSESEINQYFRTEETQISCYILNGEQTSIPCEDGVEPERNSETGTWFINGENTGYTYKGVQVTIKAIGIGNATLKMSGTIKGKQYEASTVIKVAKPDPASIVLDSKYEEGLVFVKKGESFNIDYKISAKTDSIAEPSQDVTYKIKTNNGVVSQNGNVFKAEKSGLESITITAAKESFAVSGKYVTISATAQIVVLDDLNEETMAKLVAATKAINNIGDVNKSDDSKEKIELAKAALVGVDVQYVPNYETYEKACRRILTLRVNAAVNAINVFKNNRQPEETDKNKKAVNEAVEAKQAVEDVKALCATYMEGDSLSSSYFTDTQVAKYEEYKTLCTILDEVVLYVASNWRNI